MRELDKVYLGDSVYASHDGTGMFRLTTENGYGPTNEIFLEGPVLEALRRYTERVQKAMDSRSSI